ncbi:MAG: replication and repair protein RecF [Candidatus Saccharibacteria bacterium]|nr:replication and repair protein RecF [Candidatus Saccharibacteria bacterium]
MSLLSLRLQHFRSYDDADFVFESGVNIIAGRNGSGKTNLLEAVLVIARGQSYRAKDVELLSYEAEWARLDGELTDGSRTVKYQTLPLFKKSFDIGGQPLSRLSLQKTLPVVVFEPNHLMLLHGSPDLRRSYLDDVLEQTVPGYGGLRRNYRRVLAQRNALLKKGMAIAVPQMFPWDVRLSELGGQIARQRQSLIEKLQADASTLYEGLAGVTATVDFDYDSQWHAEHYESLMLRKLESNIETDIQRGFTTAGPHRDDMFVRLNGQPANITASRGETRSIVLLCKVLELRLLESSRQQTPLLLLDDVFSELDTTRRHALTGFLEPYQTFLTTTDADMLAKDFSGSVNLVALTT